MRFFFGSFLTGRAAAGLLIFRLAFGLGISAHGVQKILSHGPENWRTGWLTWFEPAGGIPAPLQGLATLAEFFGGIGIMLGLLTPLAAFTVLATMIVALLKVHLPAGAVYVSLARNGPEYELCAHYLITGLVLLLTGPGACSLDHALFARRYQRNPYAP